MRRNWFLQTAIGLALLPVSALPIYVYTRHTDSGYLLWLNARYKVAPPGTGDLGPEAQRLARAHGKVPYKGVPVLVYHGIGRQPADTEDRRFVVSRRHFADQMLALRAAGYHAITTGQLATYIRTRDRGLLPRRPVLISFDDGRVDAMLQGDRVLRGSGMRATMFVIGRAAESHSPYYEQWGDLQKLAKSGRWELAAHTYDLHHQRRERGGKSTSALVHVKPGESLLDYTARLRADIAHADRLLADHGASRSVAFAYPFGDYGQHGSPRVARILRRALAARFRIAFDQERQDDWQPTLPRDDRLHLHRLSVEDWSAPAFLRRLERGYRSTASSR